MRLTPEDWGRFRAYPRLVDYLTETTRHPSAAPCARLILYRNYAVNTLEFCQRIDALSHPSNFPGPKFGDQHTFQEKQIADLIESRDPDFLGMLAAARLTTEQNIISHVYARTVLGNESDPNCDQILNAFRQAGFRVPRVGTCR
jgi:hypothetical protein